MKRHPIAGICDSSNCSKCGNSFNPFSAGVVRIEEVKTNVPQNTVKI